MSKPLRLCILISGNGSNLQSIIDAIENGHLGAKIVGVISNNPDAYGLQRAAMHGIHAETINHKDYETREQFDQALRRRIVDLQADIIVLAGFMRILSSSFIQALDRRILNIHPSLLPKYKGLNTQQRAIENGDKEHGISIHLVTAELDDGPLLMQQSFPITETDSVESLQSKGHAYEHKMYPALLQSIVEGRLVISADDILFDQSPLQHPLSLSDVSQS